MLGVADRAPDRQPTSYLLFPLDVYNAEIMFLAMIEKLMCDINNGALNDIGSIEELCISGCFLY